MLSILTDHALTTPPETETPITVASNTTPPETELPIKETTNTNTLVFVAFGGVCAASVVFGIFIGIFVSKKNKAVVENPADIHLQSVVEGKV